MMLQTSVQSRLQTATPGYLQTDQNREVQKPFNAFYSSKSDAGIFLQILSGKEHGGVSQATGGES
jgi:hypothetical protein